jgi:GMP synthase-like glutamine amidotransferase
MRIAILETGAPPEPLIRRFGDYPAMMRRMLEPLAPRASFLTAKVAEGDLPSFDAFDAALITGSAAGAYEDHPWIAPLEAFIRDAAAAKKPQVGICFGHQIMAQAFGGTVRKSDRGWGVGVHDYEVVGRERWMAPEARRFASPVSHQDQVVEAPPGAKALARSEFCPYAVLAYAQGPAISFQMHPEFDHDYAAALVERRYDRVPKSVADEALASLKRPSDRALLARWIANFFSGE